VNWRLAIKLLIFTVVHLALTLVAPHFFTSAGLVTLFWPATGLALAATLAGGYAYAIATLLSCIVAALIAPEKGIAQVFFTTANALEILMARFALLRLAKIDITFDRSADYIKFIFYAGILLPIPGALIAAAAVKAFSGTALSYWFIAQAWWMADSLGILSLTPLLLVWRQLPKSWFDRRRIIEAVLGLALAVIASYWLLGGPGEIAGSYPRAFLFFIFVAWAATRFGRHATVLVTSIVLSFAVAFAMQSGHGKDFNFANIWLFMVTLSTVGMALATVFNEKRESLVKIGQLLEAYRNEESRRKKSDSLLATTTIDFQRLVETAEEGVWTIDIEGRTTFVNQRMADIVGYSRSEILSKNFLDLMIAKEREIGLKRLHSRNSGKGEAHETVLIHKNGSPVWTYMQTNPISDIEGNVTGALAMVTDITIAKQTQQALRESEDRFRAIVEGIQDAVLVHQSGIIKYANSAAVKLMGARDAADVIGRNGLDLDEAQNREIAIQRTRDLQNTDLGTTLPAFRREMVRFDGKKILVETTATTILFNGQKASLIIGREIKLKN